VQTSFEGQPSGFFCLWKRGDAAGPAACAPDAAPYVTQYATSSVDGDDGTYCRLRTSTCQAFNEFEQTCTNEDANDECGLGIGDGLCRLNESQHRCTYQCLSSADCKGSTCETGEDPHYCTFTPAQ